MKKDEFESRIKSSLDNSVQAIDADTRKRLADIRRLALNQPAKTSWLKRDYWLPATSLAFCTLLAVFFIIQPNNHSSDDFDQNQQVAMLELLNNAEDLEVISDPDFYLWADEVLEDEAKGNAV